MYCREDCHIFINHNTTCMCGAITPTVQYLINLIKALTVKPTYKSFIGYPYGN